MSPLKKENFQKDSLHEKLKEQIDKAPVAYVDETSFREKAQTHYVWTASNKNITWLKVLPGRSIANLKQLLGEKTALNLKKQVGQEIKKVPQGKRKGQTSIVKF